MLLHLKLLLIEQSVIVVAGTETEGDTLIDKLKKDAEFKVFDQKFKQLNLEVDSLEKKIWELKMRKFDKDRRGYKSGRVYNWTFDKQRPKKVSWASDYSNMETTDGDNSAGTLADRGPSHRIQLQ